MVTLKVVLDGETQGNTYQNTLASLQMNFAVEKTGTVPGPDGGGPEGGKPDGSGGGDTPGAPGGNTPRTSGPRGLYPAQRKDRGPIAHAFVVGNSFGQRGSPFCAGGLVFEKGEGGQ